tara:strand:+ start:1439 stop:1663 length:225 start_codon:yes stop_codon:yes gene_type:complete
MIESMTVKSIRYFNTRRGVGYQAQTNEGTIWNDGNGGATYFRPDIPKYTNKDFGDFIYDEKILESLIDTYEEKL